MNSACSMHVNSYKFVQHWPSQWWEILMKKPYKRFSRWNTCCCDVKLWRNSIIDTYTQLGHKQVPLLIAIEQNYVSKKPPTCHSECGSRSMTWGTVPKKLRLLFMLCANRPICVSWFVVCPGRIVCPVWGGVSPFHQTDKCVLVCCVSRSCCVSSLGWCFTISPDRQVCLGLLCVQVVLCVLIGVSYHQTDDMCV
jgi:hypothetical protein